MRHLTLVPAAALPARDVFGRDQNPRDYRRYLGQTRDHLAWDASGGLYPNAFAALAATLGDGHDLALHLPDHYPDGDPDHLRLLDYGEAVAACRDHFNARLRRLIDTADDASGASRPDTIEHTTQPQIILGRRGRGKTTRLAAKIRWLGEHKTIPLPCTGPIENAVRFPWVPDAGEGKGLPMKKADAFFMETRGGGVKNRAATHHKPRAETARILVITPYRSNLERLRALLPDAANCLFLPPDDALNRLPPAAHLIIDEAASIPPAQLLALTAPDPAYTLAAPEDGDPGNGRAFSLHVLPALIARDTARVYRHQHALRHAHHDPLEQVLENAFLLHPTSPTPPAPATIRRVSRRERARDETLLRGIYSLLHQAHYRTSPEDLKQLLDLPGQSLYIAASGAEVAGVLHIRHESPLPADLAAAVLRGERRPQGRLLLQQLLIHTQNPAYNQPLARISRIAVHAAHRRQGIAAALIAHARADIATPLGVSYGHSDDLAAFWQALGFREIHRSASGKARPTSLRLCP